MRRRGILVRKIFKDNILSSIIIAEELARELKEFQEKRLKEIAIKGLICKTKFKRKYNENIRGIYDILTLSNVRGKLREMSIVTDSKNFMLELVVDNFKFYNDTWDKLSTMSNYSELIDAFEYDGNYVLRIGEAYFNKSLILRIQALKSLTIKQLIVVYDICQ